MLDFRDLCWKLVIFSVSKAVSSHVYQTARGGKKKKKGSGFYIRKTGILSKCRAIWFQNVLQLQPNLLIISMVVTVTILSGFPILIWGKHLSARVSFPNVLIFGGSLHWGHQLSLAACSRSRNKPTLSHLSTCPTRNFYLIRHSAGALSSKLFALCCYKLLYEL